MFFKFILIIAIGFVLYRLGSVTVWASVLAWGLKAAVLVIAAMLIAFAWKQLFARN